MPCNMKRNDCIATRGIQPIGCIHISLIFLRAHKVLLSFVLYFGGHNICIYQHLTMKINVTLLCRTLDGHLRLSLQKKANYIINHQKTILYCFFESHFYVAVGLIHRTSKCFTMQHSRHHDLAKTVNNKDIVAKLANISGGQRCFENLGPYSQKGLARVEA